MLVFLFPLILPACPTGEIQIGPMNGHFFIPSSQYYGCNQITKVKILEGINRIGSYSFFQCNLINHVAFPSTLRNIESYSFQCCLSLTSLTFPEGLTNIGIASFQYCNLLSIYLPSTIQTIGFLAFQSNPNLNSITDSGKGNFYAYKNVMIVGHNSIVSCSEFVSQVEFPPNVEIIDSHSFCFCSKITTLLIPNHIIRINSRAFYGCSMLESVTIGSGVNEMFYDLFEECFKLKNINVDSKNNQFESKNNILFSKGLTTMIIYPIGLTSTILEIPIQTTAFEAFCFSGVKNLNSFLIPSNHPTFLPNYNIIYSKDKTILYRIPPLLTSFTLLTEVKKIYKGACVGCTFTSFQMPKTLEFIGDFSFRNTLIESILIPKTVKYLGVSSFLLTKLISVTFEDGIQLETLGVMSFGSTLITGIDLPNSLLSIQTYCFQLAAKLKKIKLSSNLVRIEDDVFQGCSELESIIFPESLEYIGNNAFANCIGLTEIRIPYKTREIGRYGFGLCTGITKAILDSCETKYYDDTFIGIFNLTKICISSKQFTITPKTKVSAIKHLICSWFLIRD